MDINLPLFCKMHSHQLNKQRTSTKKHPDYFQITGSGPKSIDNVLLQICVKLITYRYYSHTEKAMWFYEQNKKTVPTKAKDLSEKNKCRKTRIWVPKIRKKKSSYTLYPTKQLTSNFKWNARHYLQRYLRGTRRQDNETTNLLWKSFFLEWYYPEIYSWNCVLYLPFWEMYFCKRNHIQDLDEENLPAKVFSSETKIFQNNSNWIFYSPITNTHPIWLQIVKLKDP